MRRAIACAALACSAFPHVARADDAPTENVCFEAAVTGQKARKSGDLPAARAAFLRCAQAACPAEVTDRCTGWIAEVDAAMPTVIVAPQDEAGRDATRGTVMIDRVAHAEAFEGKPITLTPGAHVVRYEIEGRAPVEQSIVVRESEKNRRVIVRLAPLPTKSSSAPFVIGAFGAASGLVFGGFAIGGALDRSSSHCDTGCSASAYSRVNAELVTADVALGVAVVLVTVAVVDFFVARGRAKASTATALPFVVRF